MKTLLKKTLVLAVMLGTLTSYATENSEVTPLTSNYVTKGSLISVSDANGEVIYSGKINYNGNLTTLFDFTQLNDGKYTVEINKDFEIEISTIKVNNHVVTYVNSDKKKIHKPVFRSENGKILISKLAVDSTEMSVDLFYNNELIHSENVNGQGVINRIYKLDKTLHGEYTAVVKTNDRVFVENFRI